jgi:hypothetical protein
LKNALMDNLNDYVKIYHKVLDEDLCEFLILSYEMSSDNREIVKNKVINFTQLNINVHCPNLLGHAIKGARNALQLYKTQLPVQTRHFPKNSLALEEFRVKCYNGGTGEQFATHVDVGDYNSAKRYLAFLFYLNDDFTGGETRFFSNNLIKPKTGSVVVFPPTWQYPHAGLPVDVGTKYIMSTYLHYT